MAMSRAPRISLLAYQNGLVMVSVMIRYTGEQRSTQLAS